MTTIDIGPAVEPEALGLDLRELSRTIDAVGSDPASRLHSILLLRRGVLVFERYLTAPTDGPNGPGEPVSHNSEMPHGLMSITKTILALLIGVARDRGLFPELDTPIVEASPAYADLHSSAAKRVTLRHALTMTAGLFWNEWRSIEGGPDSNEAALATSDPVRFLLTSPFEFEPGTRHVYNSMLSHALMGVLRTAVGEPVADFARRVLWEPLGMAAPEWGTLTPGGEVCGGWGLRMRPRDTARIGQLILNRGLWGGAPVVSSAWIDEMTRPQIPVVDPIHHAAAYGYQVWIDRSEIGGRSLVHYDGKGSGGQYLSIVPDLDLVFVVNAGYFGGDRQTAEPLDTLNRLILPFVSD